MNNEQKSEIFFTYNKVYDRMHSKHPLPPHPLGLMKMEFGSFEI